MTRYPDLWFAEYSGEENYYYVAIIIGEKIWWIRTRNRGSMHWRGVEEWSEAVGRTEFLYPVDFFFSRIFRSARQ